MTSSWYYRLYETAPPLPLPLQNWDNVLQQFFGRFYVRLFYINARLIQLLRLENKIAELFNELTSIFVAALQVLQGLIFNNLLYFVQLIIGILSFNGALSVYSFEKMITSIFGSIIVLLGSIVSCIQILIGIQRPSRALNDSELVLLQKIFAQSVPYQCVRIIEGNAGLFSINDRPFVLGNKVFLKKERGFALLVHEMVHIWQYFQLGPQYSINALFAQYLLKDAYCWEDETQYGFQHWQYFNLEAQAVFIEALFINMQNKLLNKAPKSLLEIFLSEKTLAPHTQQMAIEALEILQKSKLN